MIASKLFKNEGEMVTQRIWKYVRYGKTKRCHRYGKKVSFAPSTRMEIIQSVITLLSNIYTIFPRYCLKEIASTQRRY